jgi:hypothetical protein
MTPASATPNILASGSQASGSQASRSQTFERPAVANPATPFSLDYKRIYEIFKNRLTTPRQATDWQ